MQATLQDRPAEKYSRHFSNDNISLEQVERQFEDLYKETAADFTKKLISDIKVFQDPEVDCSSMGEGMERIFNFTVREYKERYVRYKKTEQYPVQKEINAFPEDVTVCARFNAPSWADSTCDTSSRPHVCVKSSRDGETKNEYCAKAR